MNYKLNRTWKTIALILLAVTFSGCRDPNWDKISGIWEIETGSKVADRLDNDGSSDQEESDGSPMTVEFRRSGELFTETKMGAIAGRKSGQWDLVSADGKRITVNCTIGLQQTETEIEFIDDDTIEMVPPNMAGLTMNLRFKRK